METLNDIAKRLTRQLEILSNSKFANSETNQRKLRETWIELGKVNAELKAFLQPDKEIKQNLKLLEVQDESI